LIPSFKKFAPGWIVKNCGTEMEPGLHARFGGKKNVFVTHPLDKQTACVLSRTATIPAEGKTVLRLVAGHHPKGDWTLIVKANGEQVLCQEVGKETAKNGWLTATVDLSRFAGQKVKLEVLNQASGWAFEAAYWAEINLTSDK
jgi:hypothetical protein